MVNSLFISTWSRMTLGSTQPHIQWVPRAISPGVKRPGREVRSLKSSTEVKNDVSLSPDEVIGFFN
jgi:hypothetical protein